MFGGFFQNRSHVAQTVFIVVILYGVSSINVLILALGIVPYLNGAYLKSRILTGFALISLGTVLIVSVYHLYTMISRKKRRSDIEQFERQAA